VLQGGGREAGLQQIFIGDDMKITLIGSVKFAENIIQLYERLKEIDHTPLMHEHIFDLAKKNKEMLAEIATEHAEHKKKHNYIKWWYECILSGDAVLVCNFDNNGIKNNIGGNTFLEIGFAYVNNKKIFLLNPVPDVQYKEEILAMDPIVLNGDLEKIGVKS
jgi:hypothetical protein